MACGNVVGSEFLGAGKEGIKFYLSIAEHIRIRCTTFFILIEHIVHHPLSILDTQVYKIEWDTDLTGNHFGNKAVLFPLAVSMKSCGSIVPVLHEQSEHIIALLLQNKSSNTRINATRKAYTHLYFAIICHKTGIFK